ncbi:MAG: hypothetical protein A2X64_03290 [Ignavibacteria bacterium GWF2_33_9]|nr:MAG: hypothetical protein A2X64_03290 [Ignavibacteria bacterium GWF2_33_9]
MHLSKSDENIINNLNLLKHSFAVIAFIFFLQTVAYSQSDSLYITPPKKTSFVKDTLAKSPTGAVLRSLALPGWGQYYVESYWKAPIFVAGWGTLIFFIYDNNSKYQDAATEYANYTGTDDAEYNFLYRKREYFRDYRDLNIFYLAGVYIISAVDAYVGAQLFEFSVDDNLSMNTKLNQFGLPEIGVKIKF